MEFITILLVVQSKNGLFVCIDKLSWLIYTLAGEGERSAT